VVLVEAFVGRAVAARPQSMPVVACFYAVRDLPYALDGAHDAAGLLVQGRGDCLAKSELMRLAAQELEIPARYACWLYRLPDVVPEVAELPSRLDVHRAVQVRIGGTWVLADATHHPGLRGTGLRVSDWDGRLDTQPGYPPVGPVIVEDVARDAARQAREQVQVWTASCPVQVLARWRAAYIAWLKHHE
jgi:transglutaminase-like putative cysteine protease